MTSEPPDSFAQLWPEQSGALAGIHPSNNNAGHWDIYLVETFKIYFFFSHPSFPVKLQQAVQTDRIAVIYWGKIIKTKSIRIFQLTGNMYVQNQGLNLW